MRTITALLVGLALAIAVSGCSRPSGAAAAADAMGASTLNSIQFSGSGTNYAYGQAYQPGGPWPRFEVKNYTAAVDYQTPAMRLDMLRAQGEHPPRGGGAQGGPPGTGSGARTTAAGAGDPGPHAPHARGDPGRRRPNATRDTGPARRAAPGPVTSFRPGAVRQPT